jgi:hypothetical protein
VLTLENYQQTLYAVIRGTSYAAALWFICWIVIGRYIFLSLFLTVVLDSFQVLTGLPVLPAPAQPPPMPALALRSIHASISSSRGGFLNCLHRQTGCTACAWGSCAASLRLRTP